MWWLFLSLVMLVTLRLMPQFLFVWCLPSITFYYFLFLTFSCLYVFRVSLIVIVNVFRLVSITLHLLLSIGPTFLCLKIKSLLALKIDWYSFCLELIPFSPFYWTGHHTLSFFFFPLHCVACGILIPQPGIKLQAQQWKSWVLTTGLPWNCPHTLLLYSFNFLGNFTLRTDNPCCIPPQAFMLLMSNITFFPFSSTPETLNNNIYYYY